MIEMYKEDNAIVFNDEGFKLKFYRDVYTDVEIIRAGVEIIGYACILKLKNMLKED